MTKIVQWWRGQDNLIKALLVPSLLFSFFSLYLIWVKPNWQVITIFPPKVYEPYESIYQEYKEKLGTQDNGPEVTIAYKAEYEHATTVFLDKMTKVYLLGDDSKWTEEKDPQYDANPNWHNNKWLKGYFKPKNGLEPPYGSVAKLWYANPNKWSRIGYRKKGHCNYKNVHYQRFKNGFIIGPFPRPGFANGAIIYILINNDRQWDSTQPDTQNDIPECIVPPDGEVVLNNVKAKFTPTP